MWKRRSRRRSVSLAQRKTCASSRQTWISVFIDWQRCGAIWRWLLYSPAGSKRAYFKPISRFKWADTRSLDRRFELLIEENPTWDTVARLAHWNSKLGDAAEADRLYEQAEDDLSAKQMLSYAWLELQRGMVDFNHGRYREAGAHYRRAEAGYPGHWQTAEHFAELHAAEGNFDEAETLLLQVIARTSKPEIKQALGELYLFTDRTEQAQPWFDSALNTYLESVQRGGVHYFHHLADFYADARLEPAEALKWAEQDIEMRPNFSTQATLAWTLFRNGRINEALEYIILALDSGVRDAVLYSCASELFEAAGETARSAQFAKLAMETNPKYRNFRIHH